MTAGTLAAPFIVAEDDILAGEPRERITAAVHAGVIEVCRYGVAGRECPARPWPCGFAHTGQNIYHLRDGKTWADYGEVAYAAG